MPSSRTPRTITYDSHFNGKPILTDKDNNLGCYEDILQANEQLFDAASNKSKRLFMRMDVRYPQDTDNHTDNNKKFTSFINSFNTHLKRKNLDPYFLWVKEQSREKHAHAHSFYLLDGQHTRRIKDHIEKAEELWARQNGLDPSINHGLIDDCTKDRNGNKQKNGIMLRQDKPAEYQDKLNQCFKWASYLAKVNTKNIPKNMKSFGHTRLKNDPSTNNPTIKE